MWFHEKKIERNREKEDKYNEEKNIDTRATLIILEKNYFEEKRRFFVRFILH